MSIFKGEAGYLWANPKQVASIEEVLRPTPPERIALPQRAALNIEPNSPKQALIDKIAARVRSIYNSGQRRVPYDEKKPEPFFDACFETAETWLELDKATDDPYYIKLWAEIDAIIRRNCRQRP